MGEKLDGKARVEIQKEIDHYVIEARRLREQEKEHKRWEQTTREEAEECELRVRSLERRLA